MVPKPVVSLHGSGESVVLSNLASEWVLMQGSTGLGWGPQEVTTAALPQGGSVLRHRRTTEAEVMVPILLGGDFDSRFAGRRLLERLCSDVVEVRVTVPSGDSRSRFGYYKEGLEGSYGEGEDAQDGQKLALTFVCPDPYWYGAERTVSRRVSAARKPLITAGGLADPEAPGEIVSTNLLTNGSFEGGKDQAGMPGGAAAGAALVATSTGWAAYGTRSLQVTPGTSNATWYHLIGANSVSGRQDAMVALGVEPGKTYTVAATVRLTGAQTGSLHKGARSMILRGNVTGDVVPTAAPNAAGVTRVVGTITLDPAETGFGIFLMNGSANASEQVWWDAVTVEEGVTSGEYWDGDTPDDDEFTYEWTGERNASPSIKRRRPTYAYGFPFFPVLVSPSVVQGRYEIQVQGDDLVWPVWTITGPGKDVLLSDVHGNELFIEGEVTSPITVVTSPQEQTVYDSTGPIWSRVPVDRGTFFPLQPGTNLIEMSMVDGTPASEIRLSYRERYKAGY